MGTGQLFNVFIDLPKSDYFFTMRVTFLAALLGVLSVFFVAVDTAIEDIISCAVEKISKVFEDIMMSFGGLLCPQVACA